MPRGVDDGSITLISFAARLAVFACLAATSIGCSKGEPPTLGPPILEGTVKTLIVRDRPVEMSGVGQWTFTTYADDGKTRVSVYPQFIVVHQEDGSYRVVPHGWYEILVVK